MQPWIGHAGHDQHVRRSHPHKDQAKLAARQTQYSVLPGGLVVHAANEHCQAAWRFTVFKCVRLQTVGVYDGESCPTCTHGGRLGTCCSSEGRVCRRGKTTGKCSSCQRVGCSSGKRGSCSSAEAGSCPSYGAVSSAKHRAVCIC